MSLSVDVQSAAPGAQVELFDLDATALGGGVSRFIKGNPASGLVVWKGNVYTPAAFVAEGFGADGRGALPQPRIRIAKSPALMSLLLGFGDLIGATLTRWRTFSKYLDGQPEADQGAHFPPDIFSFDRKSADNKVFIEWELRAAMDQQGKQLPARQALRDICGSRYRVWDAEAGAFDYSRATCPYSGAGCFDVLGAPTSQAGDKCGKRLSDCKLRYGANPLPADMFPGVARTRI